MSRAHTGMSRSLAARAVQQHDKKKRASSNQKEYLIRILNAANFKSFPACCRPDGFSIFFAATAKPPLCQHAGFGVFSEFVALFLHALTVCSRAACSLCVPMISTPVKCTELHCVQDVCVLLPLWIIIPYVHIFLPFGNMGHFPVSVCNKIKICQWSKSLHSGTLVWH